ncbi:hypothetical protein ABEB36_001716 [Hypothenemus hampei]|uniref:Uncharacterized protein n=1 Tax=Hypothenemus hampei TaxID=57062 RepID=A0ABD1FGH8_HYPHA
METVKGTVRVRPMVSYELQKGINESTIMWSFLLILQLPSNRPKDHCVSKSLWKLQIFGIRILNITEITIERAQEILDIFVIGPLGKAAVWAIMDLHSPRTHSIFITKFCMRTQS